MKKWISPSRWVPRWLEWVSNWPLAPFGASRLKFLTCSGSYVGHGGVPMPKGLDQVEPMLRRLGQQKLADDFVATMNHAAEEAVPA